MLKHDHNALLVPTGDADAAARAIARLIAEPELSERLSAGARATSADLTWDARAARILAFLETRRGALAPTEGAFSAHIGSPVHSGEVRQPQG